MKQDVLRNPCYDPVTKTSCPRRCAGCAVFCEDWAEYLKKRNEGYEEKIIKNNAMTAANYGYVERNEKWLKNRHSQGKRKKYGRFASGR